MEVSTLNDNSVYIIIIIKLLSNFKKHLKNRYIKNHQLQKIHNITVKLGYNNCGVTPVPYHYN